MASELESFIVWCKREEDTHTHTGTGRLLDYGHQGSFVEEAAFELGHGG